MPYLTLMGIINHRKRWLHQFRWWDKRAADSRRWYYSVRVIIVLGGILLPFLTTASEGRTVIEAFPDFVTEVESQIAAEVGEYVAIAQRAQAQSPSASQSGDGGASQAEISPPSSKSGFDYHPLLSEQAPAGRW